MDNIKIYATIALPGRVMVAEKSISEKDRNKFYDEFSLLIDVDKKKKERITVKVRKSIPAKQVLHLSQDAYDEFLSSPVQGTTAWYWKKMKNDQKVKAHLEVIAYSLGGTLSEFEIMQD